MLRLNSKCFLMVMVALGLFWSAPAGAANFTSLFTAIALNDVESVKAMAPQGSVINSVDRSSGATPLTWASQRGIGPSIAAYLISIGAEIELRDAEGRTPLTTAIIYGNVGVARLLLDRGANPNSLDGRKGKPLVLACANGGNAEIVKALLSKGAKVDGPDGQAAVETAVECQKPEIVKLLVEKGARPRYFGALNRLLHPEPPPVKLTNRYKKP